MNENDSALEDNYGDDDIPEIDLPHTNNESNKSKTIK